MDFAVFLCVFRALRLRDPNPKTITSCDFSSGPTGFVQFSSAGRRFERTTDGNHRINPLPFPRDSGDFLKVLSANLMFGAKRLKEKFAFLFPIAACLLFAACGSNLEESAGTPISSVQLAERIRAGWPPVILDVRSGEEFGQGHIPGAINIPHDELAGRLAELSISKSEEIVVHCQSGRRAQKARATLRDNDYSNVRDLSGHWQGWKAAGLPTE